MKKKYFAAYYQAISRAKKIDLDKAAAERFNRAEQTMRKKFCGTITVEDDEILFAISWMKEHCPVTTEEVDEQLSHDQTTDDRLGKFHREVIEARESYVEPLAEAHS